MTGGNLLPVAAVFIGVVAANLALAWLLARREWEPPEILNSVRYSPPSEPSSDARDSEALSTDGPEFAVDAGSEPDATSNEPVDDLPPLDGETVTCRHCGAENRPDFRYCRWCVQSGFAADDTGVGSAMTDRSL
jgi:hypothetical protein